MSSRVEATVADPVDDTRGDGRVETKPRAGRRPGRPDTRAAVLAAAKASFAQKGFDRTTIRGIATAAGVDAALIHHYFGSKDDLFLAALEIPFDPRQVIPELARSGVDGLGTRIAETFVGIWDVEANRLPLVAMFRTAMTNDDAATLLRNGMARLVLDTVAQVLDVPDAAVRAQLVASQLLGLALARYLLRLEPLASLPAAEVVAAIGPTLQRYLDGV
ncbi:MAG: TetR/AcrR family transcriptional regulator [Nocardioidaceae bacterium]|nr:TetR/AcrR family transcriptional regulator [Nocardioidaceae bacterium]